MSLETNLCKPSEDGKECEGCFGKCTDVPKLAMAATPRLSQFQHESDQKGVLLLPCS